MRECYNCGSIKTYIRKDGFEHWYNNRPLNQWLCEKCNNILIKNPKWHPITNPVWHEKTNKNDIIFVNKNVYLSFNPRTGRCSRCINNIYDRTCKQTHMHHWVYIIILPWFGTEELCASCHRKETIKLSQNK